MAIADTITSMQNHTSNAYTILNYATDLTGTNKNLANLKQCIFDSIINSMSDTLNPTWNNLPKITTTPSTSQSINNTIEAPMRIELGASALEQATTTGKNLLNYVDNLLSSSAGLTSTINADGSITTTGKPSYNYPNILVEDITSKLINGQTYTISQATGQAGLLYLQINIVDNGGGATTYCSLNAGQTSNSFTADTTNKTYSLRIQTGTTANWGDNNRTITNFYQLEKGSTATTFEKYTAGASPNPSYPQDIHTISGDNTISIDNKNMLNDELWESGSIDGSTGQNTPAPYNARGTNYIKVKPSTTYTISANTNLTNLRISEYKLDKTHIQRDVIASNNSLTITTTANTYYVRWSLNYNNSVEVTQTIIKNIQLQLEKGNTRTSFIAFNGTDYSVNLGNIEYCKIGNYEDRIFKNISTDTDYSNTRDEGAWYIKKSIGKVVLDGTNVAISSKSGTTYNNMFLTSPITNILKPSSNAYLGNIISNLLEAKTVDNIFANDTYGIGIRTSGEIVIGVTLSSPDNTVPLINTWLESNNITCYYALSTPTYTQITGTLAEQLEAVYYEAMSKEGQTNISQINDDLPFIISAETLKSMANL